MLTNTKGEFKMAIKNFCEICNEEVHDPICLRCHNRELLAWLRENIWNEDIIKYITSKIARMFLLNDLGKEQCIICKKENRFVCSYCYIFAVKRILQELNISEDSIKSFSVVFNCRDENQASFGNLNNQDNLGNQDNLDNEDNLDILDYPPSPPKLTELKIIRKRRDYNQKIMFKYN